MVAKVGEIADAGPKNECMRDALQEIVGNFFLEVVRPKVFLDRRMRQRDPPDGTVHEVYGVPNHNKSSQPL
jgi:hypothetical protein